MAQTMPQLTTTVRWQWNRHAFRAMNTNVYTTLFSQTDAAVLHDVERLFASFERRLSRFLPASELCQLNNSPREAFKASPTLFSALEVALWAAHVTGGLYDPTMLSQLERAGYNRSFEQIDTPLPLSGQEAAPAPVDKSVLKRALTFRSVELNRATQEVYKPVGLKLDLGGMGKGWTVDRAADRLQGLGPFLVNAGGDIFAYQTPPGERGWQIDLVHPYKPDESMARLFINHRALATSTIARRRWQQHGRIMHHLLDPRTGEPAQTDAVSVTVVADRTVLAEVYAKVALILGVERGLDYLNQIDGIEGLIYTANSKIVTTTGLEDYLARLDPNGYAD